MPKISMAQLAGLLIMSTASGVNAANFSPLVTDPASFVNYALHFIPMILLITGALWTSSGRTSGSVLVNISIGLYWAFAAFAIGWAIGHPDPRAFGPHNFNDYSPIVIFTAGALLWLTRKARVATEAYVGTKP